MLSYIARAMPRKEYIIAIFACLASISNGAIAQTVTVFSGGTNYTIGTQRTNLFASDKSLVETYPWYGDQALAESLSGAVGVDLPMYDTSKFNGPIFFTSLTPKANNFVFYSRDYVATHFASGDGYQCLYITCTNYYNFATLVSSEFVGSDDGDASYSISGDRYVGKILSASRDSDDPDGNGSITGYTWQSSSDGSTWSTVGTDSTYTLTGSEEGQYLRLTVAYTDGESFSESVTTSNVQAKDFTTAMARPFAALKSNNLEIVNSYVKNSLLSSQQSCATQGVEIFDGKACVHGNYSYASRYTFGDSGNNSFQAHQTAGNYGFDYQVNDSLNIGLRYGLSLIHI